MKNGLIFIPLDHDARLVIGGREPAVAIAHHNADALNVLFGHIETGIFYRDPGGGHSQLRETGHASSISLVDILAWVKSADFA